MEPLVRSVADEFRSEVHPVQLQWTDICYTVKEKKQGQGLVDKHILNAVSGYAAAGSFTAILGASGSGKTSLLSVLADRLLESKTASLTGEMLLNGDPMPSDYRTRCAYVQQTEVFYPYGTVRETVELAARMRLGRNMDKAAKKQRALDVLNQLSLTKTLDTKVGDGGRVKGISGGEMKRVGIACELVSSPSLMLLDEPTSGLDSSAALNVVKSLQQLAGTGRTVIASIHQPGSQIYELFDNIVVLAEGRLSYFGRADGSNGHFSKIGFSCPDLFNPADYVLQITSIDYSSEENETETRGFLQKIHEHGEKIQITAPKPNAQGAGPAVEASTSIGEQFSLLFVRIFNDCIRNKVALVIKLVQGLATTAIIVALYSNSDDGAVVQTTTGNSFALLFFITTSGLFGPLFGTITAFAPEINVVTRERVNNLYSVGPYYFAKLLVAMPVELIPLFIQNTIAFWALNLHHTAEGYLLYLLFTCLMTFSSVGLGFFIAVAAGGNVQAASGAVAPVALIFMLLAGFFINSSTIPVWISWLSHIDYMNWVFQGLCINQFQGNVVTVDGIKAVTIDGVKACPPGALPTQCVVGDTVLSGLFNNGVPRSNADWNRIMWDYVFFLLAMIAVVNFLAYIVLLLKGPKYVKMYKVKRPQEEQS